MTVPKLKAEFILDSKGVPVGWDTDGRRNYSIRLRVDGVPEDTHAVTYQLDESYLDPVREVRRGPRFEEEITSYGDYEITAKVRRRTRGELASSRLSKALVDNYGPDASPEIRAAIQELKKW